MILGSDFIKPYVGLRPFSKDDSLIFFGREEQTIELLDKLFNQPFLAVLGESGSGKSSLVKAGLIPALEGGFLVADRDIWEVVTFSPREDPLKNLTKGFQPIIKDRKQEKDLMELIIKDGVKSFTDFISSSLGDDTNLLILVDQFEELFTYAGETEQKINEPGSTHRNEDRTLFVNLLLSITHCDNSNIYVVITMRSEYLGFCKSFLNLPEAINNGQYLVPRLNRNQRQNAIEGPANLFGKKVSPALLDHLLNLVGDDRDQLSLIQHLLMRIWEVAQEESELSFRHYYQVGGYREDKEGETTGALTQHANAIYQSLNSKERRITRLMFRRLVDVFGKAGGVRKLVSIKEIAEVTESKLMDVMKVVEVFKAENVSFLFTSESTLNEKTTIDIVHESLFRNWKDYKEWLVEEKRDAERFLRFSEAAKRWDQGMGGLLPALDTQQAIGWLNEEAINPAWANRYDITFIITEEFIRLSRKSIIRRRRLQIASLFLVIIVFAAGSAVIVLGKRQAELEIANKKLDSAILMLETTNVELVSNKAKLETANDNLETANEILESKKDSIEEQATKIGNLYSESERLNQIIRDSSELIKQQKGELEKERNKALAQKDSTDIAKLESDRLTKVVQSQAFAAKSMQIRDPYERAILAVDAFRMAEKYDGGINGNDIYRSIYYALNTLEPEFNSSPNYHNGSINSLISYQNSFYSVSNDGFLYEGMLEEKIIKKLSGKLETDKQIYSLAISQDGTLLATGNDKGEIRLINPENLEILQTFYSDGRILALDFTQNGLLISGNQNSTIRLWQFNKTTPLWETKLPTVFYALYINQFEGNVMIGLRDGYVTEIDVRTGNVVDQLLTQSTEGNAVTCISNDIHNHQLAVGFENGELLYFHDTIPKAVYLDGHTSRVSKLVFIPSDNYLVSAGFDRSIRIWDLKNLSSLPIIIDDFPSWITALTIDSTGSKIVAGDATGTIWVLPLKVNEMVLQICEHLSKRFNSSESLFKD